MTYTTSRLFSTQATQTCLMLVHHSVYMVHKPVAGIFLENCTCTYIGVRRSRYHNLWFPCQFKIVAGKAVEFAVFLILDGVVKT